VGVVLEPAEEELAVSYPCVLELGGSMHMFYASDDGETVSIGLATSHDGVAWDRRGLTLTPSGEGPAERSVHSPCVVRLKDGSLHMWYCGLPAGDITLGYRICSARLPSFSAP
jgi:hypothetical protein